MKQRGNVKWVVNKDEALELHAAGTVVGGVWRGAVKAGRTPSNPKAAAAVAMLGVVSGVMLPTGPRDIMRHGFHAAVWHPYKRVGFFDTGPEARHAIEAAVREKIE